MKKYLGAIFDLDGVLVDTAKYHYLAWKKLADRLGIKFTPTDNERLKGVSRMASLNILLSLGSHVYSETEKDKFAAEKNQDYINFISKMDSSEVLPGAVQLLTALKEKNVKIALGSASKNSPLILKNTELEKYFDVIVDGNDVSKAKPNPEVFVLGAEKLNLAVSDCVVFEDAAAGIEAAHNGEMYAVGIGSTTILNKADIVVSNLANFKVESLF